MATPYFMLFGEDELLESPSAMKPRTQQKSAQRRELCTEAESIILFYVIRDLEGLAIQLDGTGYQGVSPNV